MLKLPDHYSTAEIMQSLEKDWEALRARKSSKDKKVILDLEDRLMVLRGLFGRKKYKLVFFIEK